MDGCTHPRCSHGIGIWNLTFILEKLFGLMWIIQDGIFLWSIHIYHGAYENDVQMNPVEMDVQIGTLLGC